MGIMQRSKSRRSSENETLIIQHKQDKTVPLLQLINLAPYRGLSTRMIQLKEACIYLGEVCGHLLGRFQIVI